MRPLKLFLCVTLVLGATLARPEIDDDSRCGYPAETLYQSIKSPLPRYNTAELPTNFTWMDVDGKNFLGPIHNQRLPNWCGDCWAVATVGAMSDRLRMARNNEAPDVEISPQILDSCDTYSRGCWGGSSPLAYKFIYEHGITDSTCSRYAARGWTNAFECQNSAICWDCTSAHCKMPDQFNMYNLSEYGTVLGVDEMMSEIYARGPITCGLDSHAPGFGEYVDGIYEGDSSYRTLTHYVEIVGWGEEDHVKYWWMKNSFGSVWGYRGYMKLIRGVNNLGMEGMHCAWGVPEPEPTKMPASSTYAYNAVNGITDRVSELAPLTPEDRDLMYDHYGIFDKLIHPSVETPRSPVSRIPSGLGLPDSFTWANHTDTNYLSPMNYNQNSPHPCNSSWAINTLSALADRYSIYFGTTIARMTFSVQTLINCAPDGDGCIGGSPESVLNFMETVGLPEESCNQYIAANPLKPECSDMQYCKQCRGKAPTATLYGQGDCFAVYPERYYVNSWGTVSGMQEMQLEIMTRGSITCQIAASDAFYAYDGGVLSTAKDADKTDDAYYVSVYGWQSAEGDVAAHWLARASLGTRWGENGLLRIAMGNDNLGLEDNKCYWGVVSDEANPSDQDNEDQDTVEVAETSQSTDEIIFDESDQIVFRMG